jgi:hypothetical protein
LARAKTVTPNDFAAVLAEATLAFQQKRFVDAEVACQQILLRDADHATAPNINGLLHQTAGNHRPAVKVFVRAVAANDLDATCQLPQLPGRHEAEERDAGIPGVLVSKVRVRSDRSGQGKCAGKASCPRPRLTGGGHYVPLSRELSAAFPPRRCSGEGHKSIRQYEADLAPHRLFQRFCPAEYHPANCEGHTVVLDNPCASRSHSNEPAR